MKNKTKKTVLISILVSFVSITNIVGQNTPETPLISAVLYKGVDEVKNVLAEGVDINQQDDLGYTALIWACSYSSREEYRKSAELLISEGADVNIQAKDGTAAIIESAGNSPEIFNLLVEKGADITVKKKDGTGAFYNCLATVINYGLTFTDEYMTMINYLLANGASVDESPVSGELKGYTPLIYAARDNYLEIAKFLIEHGANVNAKNLHDQTPLSVAEDAGHTEMIQLLKAHGAK
jgi:ankyrin repeat protein